MKKKNKLNEYFEKDSIIISKDDFETAIRLFMTLVLFREEDKENKIKSNTKNIVNYLNAQDLWDKSKFKDEKFKENLNELKSINIQINQFLYFVDIQEEDTSEVKNHIENKKKKPDDPIPEPDSPDSSDSESEESGRGGRD